jgi:hypothetical protein
MVVVVVVVRQRQRVAKPLFVRRLWRQWQQQPGGK